MRQSNIPRKHIVLSLDNAALLLGRYLGKSVRRSRIQGPVPQFESSPVESQNWELVSAIDFQMTQASNSTLQGNVHFASIQSHGLTIYMNKDVSKRTCREMMEILLAMGIEGNLVMPQRVNPPTPRSKITMAERMHRIRQQVIVPNPIGFANLIPLPAMAA